MRRPIREHWLDLAARRSAVPTPVAATDHRVPDDATLISPYRFGKVEVLAAG